MQDRYREGYVPEAEPRAPICWERLGQYMLVWGVAIFLCTLGTAGVLGIARVNFSRMAVGYVLLVLAVLSIVNVFVGGALLILHNLRPAPKSRE